MKKFFSALKASIKAHNTIVDTRSRYDRRHNIQQKFVYTPKGF